jgi:hypothetical protein
MTTTEGIGRSGEVQLSIKMLDAPDFPLAGAAPSAAQSTRRSMHGAEAVWIRSFFFSHFHFILF